MNIVIHDLSSEQFEQLCSHRTEHTKEMERISLEQLAKKAEVSQPTVLRMLKAAGYTGFKEAKIAFVEERMQKKNYLNGHRFVSLMLCVPVWKNKQIVVTIQVGTRIYCVFAYE